MARKALIVLDVETQGASVKVQKLDTSVEELQASVLGAAEAKERLNKIGIQTEGQIRQEIQALEVLEQKFKEDAVATRELAQQKQLLAGRLNNVNQGVKGVTGTSSRATNVVADLGFVAQDAAYGFRGVANNIPQVVQGFSRLSSEAGGSRAAVKTLLSSLTGPAGLLFAVNILSGLLAAFGDDIYNAFTKGAEGAEELQGAIDDAIGKVIEFETEFQSFSLEPEQLEDALGILNEGLDRINRKLEAGSGFATFGTVGRNVLTQISHLSEEQIANLQDQAQVRESVIKKLKEQIQLAKALRLAEETARQAGGTPKGEEPTSKVKAIENKIKDVRLRIRGVTEDQILALRIGRLNKAIQAEQAKEKQNTERVKSLILDREKARLQIIERRRKREEAERKARLEAIQEAADARQEAMKEDRAAIRGRRPELKPARLDIADVEFPLLEIRSKTERALQGLQVLFENNLIKPQEMAQQKAQILTQALQKLAQTTGGPTSAAFQEYREKLAATEQASEKAESGFDQMGKQLTQVAFRAAASSENMTEAVMSSVRQILAARLAQLIASNIAILGPTAPVLGPAIAAGLGVLFNNLVPSFATGVTNFEGGTALVGERGPELVNLPRGSNVITNENTERIVKATHVQEGPGVAREIRALRRDIQNMPAPVVEVKQSAEVHEQHRQAEVKAGRDA